MKIEIEVSDELVKQFGKEALQIYLAFKAENMSANMINKPSDELPVSDLTPEQNERLQDAWEKVKRMGPSC